MTLRARLGEVALLVLYVPLLVLGLVGIAVIAGVLHVVGAIVGQPRVRS